MLTEVHGQNVRVRTLCLRFEIDEASYWVPANLMCTVCYMHDNSEHDHNNNHTTLGICSTFVRYIT